VLKYDLAVSGSLTHVKPHRVYLMPFFVYFGRLPGWCEFVALIAPQLRHASSRRSNAAKAETYFQRVVAVRA